MAGIISSWRLTAPRRDAGACWRAGANWRRRVLGLPYGDQGLLIHRDLLGRGGRGADLAVMGGRCPWQRAAERAGIANEGGERVTSRRNSSGTAG